MRSIFIIPMIFFLITACTTQPTAPTTTVTIPPTVTLTAAPSFTPALSPEQTQALADVNTALDQNLTANADGSVKDKNGEINKDFRYDLATGKLSLQVAGEWVMIDPADVSYDEDGNVKSIAGYELQDGKWAAAAETLSPEQLADMTPEQKLAAAPESADGYSVSNLSTVKDNLVIYRDADGKAAQVYDLTTGETLTLPEAGIAEFPMTNGEMYEMKSFDTVEEILQEIIVNDGATYGMNKFDLVKDAEAFNARRRLIVGIDVQSAGGYTMKVEGAGDVLEFAVFNLSGGTVIKYQSDEHEAKVLFLRNSIPTVVGSGMRDGKYPIPAKPAE